MSALIVVFLIVVACGYIVYSASVKTQPRRMSVFSEQLAHDTGAFPPSMRTPPESVHAALFLDELPPVADLVGLLRDKVIRHERFASTITLNRATGKYTFAPAPIEIEVHHLVQREVHSEQEILDYVETLFFRPWTAERNAGRPLWYLHVLANTGSAVPPGAPASARRSAVVLEFHHAIADGANMLAFLASVLTDKDGHALRIETPHAGAPAGDAAAQQHHQQQNNGTQDPFRYEKEIPRAVYKAFMFARGMARIAFGSSMSADSRTCIKDPYAPYLHDGERRIHVLPPISRASVKAMADKLGSSVDDVMTAVLGGALRKYLTYRADRFVATLHAERRLQMRCIVPYPLPTAPENDAAYALRNQWFPVSIRLPVGTAATTPTQRVRAVKAASDLVEQTHEPQIGRAYHDLMYHIMGYETAARLYADLLVRHTCVFANAATIAETAYLAGKRVAAVQPLVANYLPQFTLVTCDGEMLLNYTVNPKRVVEAHRIGQMYVRELEALAKECGVAGPVIGGATTTVAH